MTDRSDDRVRYEDVSTPSGELRVAQTGDGAVVACTFLDHFDRVAAQIRRRPGNEAWRRSEWRPGQIRAADALRAYVDGDLGAIGDLEVATGGTPFQQSVWAVLRRIPTGDTWSYGDLAAEVGSPGAVRAVGSANGANPVWLIIPCHRVVRSDGSLGGYGGGLERKSWLLEHEATSVT